ncbi:hypothetical protein ABPG72_019952 [Tetrahymena utriculariae]
MGTLVFYENSIIPNLFWSTINKSQNNELIFPSPKDQQIIHKVDNKIQTSQPQVEQEEENEADSEEQENQRIINIQFLKDLIETQQEKEAWSNASITQKIYLKIKYAKNMKQFKWPIIVDENNFKFVHRANRQERSYYQCIKYRQNCKASCSINLDTQQSHQPQLEIFIDQIVQIEQEKASLWANHQYQDKKPQQNGQCHDFYIKKLMKSYFKLKFKDNLNNQEIKNFCNSHSVEEIEQISILFDELIQDSETIDHRLQLNIDSQLQEGKNNSKQDIHISPIKGIDKIQNTYSYNDEESSIKSDGTNMNDEDSLLSFSKNNKTRSHKQNYLQIDEDKQAFKNLISNQSVLYPKDYIKQNSYKPKYFDQEDIQSNCWQYSLNKKQYFIHIPKWKPKKCFCDIYSQLKLQTNNKYIYIGCTNYNNGGCKYFQYIPAGTRNYLLKYYKEVFNDEVFKNYNPGQNKKKLNQREPSYNNTKKGIKISKK